MDTDAKQTAQSEIGDPQSSGSAGAGNSRNRRFSIPMIAFLIVAVSAGIGGLYFDSVDLSKPSDGMADNPAVRDFAKAIDVINDNYAITPDKEGLTRGAVSGMLHSLDPHSNFYGRREFSEMQDEQSSHFYGVGV